MPLKRLEETLIVSKQEVVGDPDKIGDIEGLSRLLR